MERQHVLVILIAALLVTLPFLRVTDTFYTSDANVYFHTSTLLMEEQSFSTDEKRKGWLALEQGYYPAMPIGYSLLAIPFAAPFLLDRPIGQGRVSLESGFAQMPPRVPGFWAAEEAQIDIHSKRSTAATVSFAARSSTPDGRNISVSRGGETVYTATVQEQWETLSIPLYLFKGSNPLTVRSSGCEPLTRLIPQADADSCASLMVRELAVGQHRTAAPSVASGAQLFWVGDQGHHHNVTNPNDRAVERRLMLEAWSYGPDDGTIHLQTPQKNRSFRIPQEGRRIVTPEIALPPGNSTLTFRPAEKNESCYRTAQGRCIRFGAAGMQFLEPVDRERFSLRGAWYLREQSGTRWSAGTAKMLVAEGVDRVSFRMRSFDGPRQVMVTVDGEHLRTLTPGTGWRQVTLNLPAGGPHHLTFTSGRPCGIPAVVAGSDDRRCLAWAVQDIRAR